MDGLYPVATKAFLWKLFICSGSRLCHSFSVRDNLEPLNFF